MMENIDRKQQKKLLLGIGIILLLSLIPIAIAVGGFSIGFTEDFTYGYKFTNLTNDAAVHGDLDNNGFIDLVVIGQDATAPAVDSVAIVYMNNGTSLYENSSWTYNLTGVREGALALGDIDNDNDLDLVLGGNAVEVGSDPIMMVYENNGTSLVENYTWSHYLTNISNRDGLAMGDYDNDGDLDLIYTEASGGTFNVRAAVNNGTAFEINSSWTAGLTQLATCSMSLNYIDNDNYLDLFFMGSTKAGADVSKIAINSGSTFVENATWVTDGNLTALNPVNHAFGDIDNDGDMDLITKGFYMFQPQFYVFVYDNNGTAFNKNSTWSQNITDSGYGELSLGDIDVDGDLDLAIQGADAVGYYAEIYTNNGTAFNVNYTASENLTASVGSMLLGDFDRDGDLDLYASGYGNGICSMAYIYQNNASNGGVFNTAPTPPDEMTTTYAGTELYLGWGNGSDTETPNDVLYYNIRVGTSSWANDTVASVFGGSSQGWDNYFGNMEQRQNATINGQVGLTYFWSVQAVDTNYEVSAWSSEDSLTLIDDPPQYVHLVNNGTNVNATDFVNFYAYVTDDNQLSAYRFGSNASGVWFNQSWNTLSGTWANITANVTVGAGIGEGIMICGIFYFNDTANQFNENIPNASVCFTTYDSGTETGTGGGGGGGGEVDVDTDGDGLLDSEEDVDGDGHVDVDEDTNDNGLLDEGEDIDGDSHLDVAETDPHNPDTDGDGYNDGEEVAAGSDPLDPNSVPEGEAAPNLKLLLDAIEKKIDEWTGGKLNDKQIRCIVICGFSLLILLLFLLIYLWNKMRKKKRYS